jgi:acyl transferase domain-containing protein/acyl carrier protein
MNKMDKKTGLEIAVIGVNGKFPKSKNLTEFWSHLKDSNFDFSTDLTSDEIINEGHISDPVNDPDYIKSSVFLEGKQHFDEKFFGYRPDEARLMDPQIRIFHECCWNALEDAGYNVEKFKGRIGLFASGSQNLNWEIYAKMLNANLMMDDYNVDILSKISYLTTLISYKLNLRGPSEFIQTACSSSLVAVHRACSSLLMGECSMALAGGVSVKNHSKKGYLYKEGMILSHNGKCLPFDNNSSGIIEGEGAGVVILKRLPDAERDNDHIYCVIKGSSVNNDGNLKIGYSAPSVKGQRDVIVKAQKVARIHPDSINYLETHGTATNLGDPIEIEALNEAFHFNGGSNPPESCLIGSVKGNIGHLDAAAGIASFIKTALVVKNKYVPQNPYFTSSNKDINFSQGPFFVNKKAKCFKDGGRFRAGVSSFGIGGTNAHVVLESYESNENEYTLSNKEIKSYIIPISAKTSNNLKQIAGDLSEYLRENSESLPDISTTYQLSRAEFNYRRAFHASSLDQLINNLHKFQNQDTYRIKMVEKQPVVFLFPGQGSQYIGMCRELYSEYSFFKKQIDSCLEILVKICSLDLKYHFESSKEIPKEEINNTEFAQPLIFIIEYAMAQSLIINGIQPDLMIGHSIGEFSAACLSGVLSLEEALRLVVKRGKVMGRTKEGSMLNVNTTRDVIKSFLTNYLSLDLAAINAENSLVISGETQEILELSKELKSAEISNRLINTTHAFHSRMMDGILPDFKEELRSISFKEPKIPYISTLNGEIVNYENISNVDYWTDHLRKPVQFQQSIKSVLEGSRKTFIEVGPGNTLLNLTRVNSDINDNNIYVQTISKEKNREYTDIQFFDKQLAFFWENGGEINWSNYQKNKEGKRIPLPGYSFTKNNFTALADAKNLIYNKNNNKEILDSLQRFEIKSEKQSNDSDQNLKDGEKTEFLNILKSFFGNNDITLNDNFFDLGGDSLTALQLVNQINSKFQINIGVKTLFNYPLLKDLNQRIEAGMNVQLPENIKRINDKEFYKLSDAQLRMYFGEQPKILSTTFNITVVLNVEKDLNFNKLKETLRKLAYKHEVLRTSFHNVDGDILQRINDYAEPTIDIINDSNNSELLNSFVRSFDLDKSPLFRIGLVKVNNEIKSLIFDIHHIISDGLSLNILVEDFYSFYNGMEFNKGNNIRYVDYAHWQQSISHKESSSYTYWKNQLEPSFSPLNFPFAKKPSSQVKSFPLIEGVIHLNRMESDAIRETVKSENISPFIYFLTVNYFFISAITGNKEIIIGTDVNGRIHSELEKIVGTFVNILPLKVDLDNTSSFLALLQRVKDLVLEAGEHQQFQFNEMVNFVAQPQAISNPIFDVHYSFANTFNKENELNQLNMTPLELDSKKESEYIFKIEVREIKKSFQIVLMLSELHFDTSLLNLFKKYYNDILEETLNDPAISLDNIQLK